MNKQFSTTSCVMALICVLFFAGILAWRVQTGKTEKLLALEASPPGLVKTQAEMLVKRQALIMPLVPLYEGLKRGDSNSVAALMAYARDKSQDNFERARAIQAIGRLHTKESLMFESSFLNDPDKQVRVSAWCGLPDMVTSGIEYNYREMPTTGEYQRILKVLEERIDQYLESTKRGGLPR